MKRLAALLVVVLLCALPVAVAQGPGTPTPEVEVLSWNAETGELHVVIRMPQATATATPVPVATETPSATPTSTPTATLTPSATPTATSTPERVCMGTVRATPSLNIRNAPNASATAIAKAQPGTRWQLFEVEYLGNDEWVRVELADGRRAWMAAYYAGQTYVEYDSSAGCALVRWGDSSNPFVTDTPAGPSTTPSITPTPSATHTPAPFVTPTPEVMGVGWTTMYGYDPALYEVGESLRGKGYAPAIVLTSNASESCAWAARNWQVVVRPWYALGLADGPDLSLTPEASARARVRDLEGYVGLLCADSANVTVQLTNEVTFPSAAYLNRWILEACKQCEARGWTCAPIAFSVGTPELDWMPTLRPALAALHEGDHALIYHAYGFERDGMLCDLAAVWTVWRVRLLRLAAGDVPWPRVVAGEVARGAGDVAPVVSDAACFVQHADGLYSSVNLWYSGGDSAWSGARWFGDAMRELVRVL